jgi:triosephosphate isomerase
MIAYEPVWAIGANGSPADVATIASAVATIRAFDAEVPVVYGGSVTAETAASFAGVPGIDGLFVGRSARPASSFAAVAHAAYPQLISTHQHAAAFTPREEGWVSSNE